MKKLLAILLVLTMAVGMFPLTAAAAENDLDECELRFDGEGWKVYAVDDIDDALMPDDLNITVVDSNNDPIDPSRYGLLIGIEDGWDEENDMIKLKKVDSPYGIADPETGFGTYGAFAIPKDGSGFTKPTRAQSFMIWHKYSFNWFGANADFGGEYEKQSTWSWHNYYEIPANRIHEPVIHGIDFSDPAPENYTITYFKRVTGVPVSDGEEYLEKVYPETEPLEGLPNEQGSYFARIDGVEPYYGTSYVDFDIVAPEIENDLDECELRFRGKEEWAEDYILNNKDDKLSLDDLDISVVTKNGETVDPQKYDLHFGIEVGYDDEKDEPIVQDTCVPLGLDSYESGVKNGLLMFLVYASAKDDSGYEGSTRRYEFMVRDRHSLERDSAYIDFGEEYKAISFRSWHYFFIVPKSEIHAPDVYDTLRNKLDSSQYDLTYFIRNDDGDDWDKVYLEVDPLAEMPTEPGTYFVRLDGKGDYYGTSYVDFDIVAPVMIGDANLDGTITISDVTAIQYYLAELTEFTDEQLALADTNGDGEVNISDATHLQMFPADFEGFVLGKS
ncbi:MAG: dockerin type I repeat-containing protein [Ruminococcus sp.]|nr:dockerin type I repeat-containing protein [Ruminococcus sp.]